MSSSYRNFATFESGEFVAMDSSIKLGPNFFVEWKPTSDSVPVKVLPRSENEDGSLNIRTLPGKGWVRLHFEIGSEVNAILGIGMRIKIAGTDSKTKIKPFLTRTDLRYESRKLFKTAPQTPLDVQNGKWNHLRGAYRATPLADGFRLDFVVDLPRGASIFLDDVLVETFAVSPEEQDLRKPAGQEVWAISEFETQLLRAEQGKSLSVPGVYAAKLHLSPDRLYGEILSTVSPLYWKETTSGRGGVIDLKDAAPNTTSEAAAKVIDERFDPPLPEDTIVHLFPSENSAVKVWSGSPESGAKTKNPVDSYFTGVTASIKNYRLLVEGAVKHPLYPGMPVRLNLMRKSEVISTTIARAPLNVGMDRDGDGLFKFKFAIPLRPSEFEGPLWISFLGLEDLAKYFINPQHETDRDGVVAYDAPPPAMPETGKVVGNVEGVSEKIIEGWALCSEETEAQVELVLYRNGAPINYSKTQFYRKDIQDIHNNLGFNGFRFEVPCNMSVLQEDSLSIEALGSTRPLRMSNFVTQHPAGFIETAELEAPRRFDLVPVTSAECPKISVIVLNRNGSGLLQDMFASCPAEDITPNIEWIIVDHDSHDDSETVCQSFAAQGINVRFMARRGNYSFSNSNNFGAEHATGDILIFANNDLIFTDAFGDRIREYLSDHTVGALGIRLLDYIDHPSHKTLEINQHLGVFFETQTTKEGWIRPYEARDGSETDARDTTTRCIAVTGAFLAMRRHDFERVGGFEEQYSYGLEDVDLCLKVQWDLGLEVVCANDIKVIHHRGFSRKKDTQAGIRRRRNNQVFSQLWGPKLRRMFKQSALSDPARMTGARPVFAFMVADVGDNTSAGEFYTSLEMGRALQKLIPCHVRYIPEENWYDLSGVDVVVSMVNRFDIYKVKNASPWLITINWMRQWFDRWADDPSVYAYDYLFASSDTASAFLGEALDSPVETLPIASQYHTFANAEPKPEMVCDYAFTGSRFGPPREIEFQLNPDKIDGEGKVFGYNWEGTKFENLSQGPVSYSKIPHVYASTRIVLDDANVATKSWGSCNSRVFDTMASGALLITNGKLGCDELFGDLVPAFHDADSLTETVNYWLNNEEERKERTEKMQAVIRAQHTYDARAQTLLESLTRKAPVRIAIKCAAIYKERQQWGDYHYAQSLAAALRRQGFVVRVDCRESWYGGLSVSDDVTITLRGLVRYKPALHQRNLLWMISHPNDVTLSELESFDHTFVASAYHAENLRAVATGGIDFMPQCTDTKRFFFNLDEINTNPTCNLYVANSRGIFRDPVKWAIQHELDIDVYGVGWEPFITDQRFKGGVISNSVLGGVYAASRLVICDHWDDMANLGYVSNRVFDVLGAGGRLAVDDVRGIDDLVPARFVDKFTNEHKFKDIIQGPDHVDLDLRSEAAAWVAEEHSFDARAKTFAAKIKELL